MGTQTHLMWHSGASSAVLLRDAGSDPPQDSALLFYKASWWVRARQRAAAQIAAARPLCGEIGTSNGTHI